MNGCRAGVALSVDGTVLKANNQSDTHALKASLCALGKIVARIDSKWRIGA